jgi:hypothetical protein
MFSRVREPTPLELEIDRAVRELKNHAIGSQEYTQTLDAIVKLHRMKEEEKPESVSRDTMAAIVANFVGMIMVIRHEHLGNVITSRAWNMVTRIR